MGAIQIAAAIYTCNLSLRTGAMDAIKRMPTCLAVGLLQGVAAMI